MSTIIRVPVRLKPGAALLYDCPLGGEGYQAQQFFKKYRGRRATFVDYGEKLVGLFDHKGRLPGRYRLSGALKVRFEGEDEVQSTQAVHFILLDKQVEACDASSLGERLGDLPHPILFYPGDFVRFKEGKAPGQWDGDVPRRVKEVFVKEPLAPAGVPRYDIVENEDECQRRKDAIKTKLEKEKSVTFTLSPFTSESHCATGEDLELVARGNAYWLYHDPTKLAFASDEKENEFWAARCTRFVSNEDATRLLGKLERKIGGQPHLSLQEAYQLCKSEDADIIVEAPPATFGRAQKRYQVMKLHSVFVENLHRVAALTDRLWAEKAKQTTAA